MNQTPALLLMVAACVWLSACTKCSEPRVAPKTEPNKTEIAALAHADSPDAGAAAARPMAEIPKLPPSPPSNMVKVAAGEFTMGCDASTHGACPADEQPARKVYLDAFMVEITEVTTAQFITCIQAGACSTPYSGPGCNLRVKGREDHPINCLDTGQGEEYCSWTGRRLPSEAQWEKAARGTDNREYPWAHGPPTCAQAVMRSDEGDSCGRGVTTWEVGSRPTGASFYGALDMAGNVAEFVQDSYDPAYYSQGVTDNPRGPKGSMMGVARGGCYADTSALRATARRPVNRGRKSPEVGFRCVGEVEP
jgi:sulfatase modifying factor 1